MLKEIVVVVDGEKYFFKGKLKAHDVWNIGGTGPRLLVIENNNENVAVFQKWDFWKKLDEE